MKQIKSAFPKLILGLMVEAETEGDEEVISLLNIIFHSITIPKQSQTL